MWACLVADPTLLISIFFTPFALFILVSFSHTALCTYLLLSSSPQFPLQKTLTLDPTVLISPQSDIELQMAVHHHSCSPMVLKAVVAVMAIGLAVYIVGPPLYWHFAEGLAAVGSSASSSSSSCAPCVCDCTSQPLLTLPDGLSNSSFADCGKRDPELSEEMENSFTDLLSEELKLREAEAVESQRRADMALLEAKKMASQYQKEADKCNSGMETCEEAREKAEAALQAQKRLSEMWEMRARQRGWNDGNQDSVLRRHLQEL